MVSPLSRTRRDLLRQTGALGVGFLGLQAFVQTSAAASLSRYGELVSDPNGVLDLPAGFSYQVFSVKGEPMNDGYSVPGAHDGMGAFHAGPGMVYLVRNHELVAATPGQDGPFFNNDKLRTTDPDLIYDAGRGLPALGGTTTLLFDLKNQRLIRHNLSLTGTLVNCAGGRTPWQTWVSCEETVLLKGERYEKHHGFAFEVPPTAPGLVLPRPLRAMGRFVHEAIGVDPRTGIVYETEDEDASCIYRFIPTVPGDLAAGGRLQALKIRGERTLDTRNWATQTVPVGETLEVTWVDLTDVEAPDSPLRLQGFLKGAAIFARGEGMWANRSGVYWACTSGGQARKGQVFHYTPSRFEGTPLEESFPGTMQLFVEPNDQSVLDGPDNVTVAPWGDLFLCEDGGGVNHVVGVTPEGELYPFARNAMNDSEFTGACFSPDGSTLFVNIQVPGMSFAIMGPWSANF